MPDGTHWSRFSLNLRGQVPGLDPQSRLARDGSIAIGKRTELALVDGDPSKNIGNVRQVEWVMRDDRLMQASALSHRHLRSAQSELRTHRVEPCRHSGESRIPILSSPVDPGLCRGDEHVNDCPSRIG